MISDSVLQDCLAIELWCKVASCMRIANSHIHESSETTITKLIKHISVTLQSHDCGYILALKLYHLHACLNLNKVISFFLAFKNILV